MKQFSRFWHCFFRYEYLFFAVKPRLYLIENGFISRTEHCSTCIPNKKHSKTVFKAKGCNKIGKLVNILIPRGPILNSSIIHSVYNVYTKLLKNCHNMGNSISFWIKKYKIWVTDFVYPLNCFFLPYPLKSKIQNYIGFIIFQSKVMVPAYLKPSSFKQRPITY